MTMRSDRKLTFLTPKGMRNKPKNDLRNATDPPYRSETMEAMSPLFSLLNQWRAAANSFLSQYEPILLLFAAILTLLLAWIFQSFINVIHENGLKPTLLCLLVSCVKLVPGVKRYIDSEKQKVVDKLQASGRSKRDGWSTELPWTGVGAGVVEKMKEEKQKDVVWLGKCSGALYIGGSEHELHFSLINEACQCLHILIRCIRMYSRV